MGCYNFKYIRMCTIQCYRNQLFLFSVNFLLGHPSSVFLPFFTSVIRPPSPVFFYFSLPSSVFFYFGHPSSVFRPFFTSHFLLRSPINRCLLNASLDKILLLEYQVGHLSLLCTKYNLGIHSTYHELHFSGRYQYIFLLAGSSGQ